MFTQYNVSVIAVVLLLLYVASFALYRTKRIRANTHRAVWNVLLLTAFLVTGAFGLLMALRRDYALALPLPFNINFWHVETGVSMTVIAVFHVGWHLGYFRDLLKRIRADEVDREGGDREMGEEGS